MAKDKFSLNNFVKTYKLQWVFLSKYVKHLNVTHESILYIKSFEKVNDRIFNCIGTYIDYYKFNSDDKLYNVRIYNDKQFYLSELNVKNMYIETLILNEVQNILNKFITT